ncbi:hypothetical protein BGZ60DRAFT_570018 [Tricladium varicosporioides]|nr:hypothetical protein BGZ60DRAFT_570018 [Hymenoscyphus varicosporioides]
MKSINIEDGFLLLALGLFSGHQYLVYQLAISPGIEVHQWNIQLKNHSPILYHVHIGSILYGLVIMLLKVSILLDWLRIFVPGVGTIVEIFQCNPREKIWNPLFEGGNCPIHMPAHMLASGIINLISDIIILALPQKVIWKLHISRRNKIGVSLLFTIGIFACACASTRLYFLHKMLNSPDQLYTVSTTGLWSIGEMTSGFLIIGIPSLPKAMKNIPLAASLVSLLRSWTTTNRSRIDNTSQSSQSRWQWHSSLSRRRSNKNDCSDVDEHELVATKTATSVERVSSNDNPR